MCFTFIHYHHCNHTFCSGSIVHYTIYLLHVAFWSSITRAMHLPNTQNESDHRPFASSEHGAPEITSSTSTPAHRDLVDLEPPPYSVDPPTKLPKATTPHEDLGRRNSSETLPAYKSEDDYNTQNKELEQHAPLIPGTEQHNRQGQAAKPKRNMPADIAVGILQGLCWGVFYLFGGSG
ncbi:hypothetical protein BKA66DRAFT_182741 [Pyrenochaeta sp. MPI-SDFR-AT-0127]|nr:hypothetical protein BKA66DRAFT_182741 [Pyrenochaeta sp. MPI-SDFR-AT-0127]